MSVSRRHFLRAALACAAPGLGVFSAAGTEPAPDRAIDAIITEALQAWEVPGAAVAIVRHDRVTYLKGFGVKELGRKGPVTPDTLFAIGSCSKAFTTTAMAMLVDEGKMAWDDPVRKHVEFFHLADPLDDANVTLRDLVTHRTGVRGHDFLWYHSPLSQEELIRKIAFLKPDKPFRGAFQYQSLMFDVAGYAVGTAAHGGWAEFIQKRLLDPLRMTGVALDTASALRSADHATPHRRNKQDQVDVIPWYVFKGPEPAGSISASVRDLSTWLRFHLNGGTVNGQRLVSASSLEETHTPQIVQRVEGPTRAMLPDTNQMSYGMAWVIYDYEGRRLESHGGAIDGMRAHITLLPDDNLGLVILGNLHETRMNLALSNRLVDHLLGLPGRDWNRLILAQALKQREEAQARHRQREAKRHFGTRPSRELSAYVGTYQEPAYGKMKVALEGGALVWRWNTFSCPLHHFHYDTFSGEHELIGEFQVVFSLGAEGQVTSLHVLEPLDVECKRVHKSPK